METGGVDVYKIIGSQQLAPFLYFAVSRLP